MEYELTQHAAKMMAERELAVEWLERALNAPEGTAPDPMDPALEHRFVRIPEFGGRMLRVIVNKETMPFRVVTAYFDRSMRGKS